MAEHHNPCHHGQPRPLHSLNLTSTSTCRTRLALSCTPHLTLIDDDYTTPPMSLHILFAVILDHVSTPLSGSHQRIGYGHVYSLWYVVGSSSWSHFELSASHCHRLACDRASTSPPILTFSLSLPSLFTLSRPHPRALSCSYPQRCIQTIICCVGVLLGYLQCSHVKLLLPSRHQYHSDAMLLQSTGRLSVLTGPILGERMIAGHSW